MVNLAKNFLYSALSCSSCSRSCSDFSLETPPTLCDNLSSAIRSFLANLNGAPAPLSFPKSQNPAIIPQITNLTFADDPFTHYELNAVSY